MDITYIQNGDYFIPNIAIRTTKFIRHYGRLCRAYLEMYLPILFNEQVLPDKLLRYYVRLMKRNETVWS